MTRYCRDSSVCLLGMNFNLQLILKVVFSMLIRDWGILPFKMHTLSEILFSPLCYLS